ncbi:uncharacterized protein K460DRAFT_354365 [Cucurbitaria berberidis CBS 394.84]|uniref:Uncharacterized protein n=1 Tax=Cucurbitaria berberidis CBS 394.84 TaxID=1168544 RepID=A0A9P4LBZ1_9PLEO|nr:uncharacterized protein K460DRAFT_354365 [Cucurbitaria berberidis CBS 394.84]KAF1849530.1 hypothetical protein K460DRAFT_354365 [Cucurbitaria berberidis CBS 394.84]
MWHGRFEYSWNVEAIVGGQHPPCALSPPHELVDIEDVALLHVAALTQPDVQNEGIIAMTFHYTYNKTLDIFRKLAPNHTFAEQVDEVLDNGTVANGRAEELLK